MPSTYRLAFDIGTSPDPWWSGGTLPLYLLPVVGILLFIVAPKFPPFFRPTGLAARRAFTGLFALITLLLAIFLTTSHYGDRSGWRDVLVSGQAEYVEGCLEGFHPMPEEGHEDEIVAVGGRVFRYSDYDLTTPFNNSRSHGGPIGPRSAVRIWHEGNNILRLEVADNACPAAPDPGRYGPPQV